MKKGFTLIEILITIAIVSILTAITVNYFNDLRQDKALLGVSETISAYLEETKTNSQAGLNGEKHGIKFATSTYTIFEGSSYDVDDPNNKELTIDSDFEIETNLTDNEIIFSRINGEPNNFGTVTIYLTNDHNIFKEVIVGELGDISVIE